MSVGALLLAAAVYAATTAYQPMLTSASTAFSISVFFLLWVLILLFVPIAAALVICALVGTGVLMGYPSALNILGSETVGLITNEELAVLPLFMIMGAFAGVAGLSSDIYRLAHATFSPFRGGLALASVGGCAGFGALTGSSLATVATIGSVAIPEMKQRGYSMQLSAGSIAAGGTLGQLIPPSTAIVLYAILVEESIGRLYIAVLIPALLTIVLYAAAILLWVTINPKLAPGRTPFNLREFLNALYSCKSVFLMFGVVIGGIYTGFFTATEAAAVGATIAFLIALYRGKLNRETLGLVVGEATRSTSMLYFVIIGAMAISFFFGTSGLPQTLLNSLIGLGLSNLAVILILIGSLYRTRHDHGFLCDHDRHRRFGGRHCPEPRLRPDLVGDHDGHPGRTRRADAAVRHESLRHEGADSGRAHGHDFSRRGAVHPGRPHQDRASDRVSGSGPLVADAGLQPLTPEAFRVSELRLPYQA